MQWTAVFKLSNFELITVLMPFSKLAGLQAWPKSADGFIRDVEKILRMSGFQNLLEVSSTQPSEVKLI